MFERMLGSSVLFYELLNVLRHRIQSKYFTKNRRSKIKLNKNLDNQSPGLTVINIYQVSAVLKII